MADDNDDSREQLPSIRLENLAKHAVFRADDTFRKSACRPGNFATAVKDLGGDFANITDAEVSFCEGWVYLARIQFGNPPNDKALVVAIKQHLPKDGEPHIMTG